MKPQLRLPCRIVHVPDALHVRVEVLHVDGTHANPVSRQRPVRHPLDLLGLDGAGAAEVGVQILGLPQPGLVHQDRIVARVVGHHDHGARIEAFDQHAALVVGGRIHRPAHHRGAAVEYPLARARQQGAGHIHIVHAFEKPEEPGVLTVEAVVVPVEDGRHAPHHAAVPQRQVKLGLGIGVERMLAAVEQFLNRDPQRRHPIGVVAVQCIRQFHELFQRLLVVNRNDFNSSQSSSPL